MKGTFWFDLTGHVGQISRVEKEGEWGSLGIFLYPRVNVEPLF